MQTKVAQKSCRGYSLVKTLTDKQLENAEENLLSKGVEICAFYSLKQVRAERFRRRSRGMDGAHVVDLIIALSTRSLDGYVTYNELSHALWGVRLDGPGSVSRLMRAMGAAILYCVETRLPIVTALITRADRTYSQAALLNLANTARYLGEKVGGSAQLYVSRQASRALSLVRSANETSIALGHEG